MPRSRRIALFVAFPLLLAMLGATRTVDAADKAAVSKAIASAASFLDGHKPQGDSSEWGVVGLALYKADPNRFQASVNQAIEHVRGKITDGTYKPHHDHLYEAGSDAMLLGDVHGEQHQAELKAISDYIISVQYPSGGWDYPVGSSHYRNTDGDTSVTQYALLGLWAAARNGVDVPQRVWNEALKWVIAHQNADGGYSYVPGTKQGLFGGASDLNMSFAGMSVILICVRNLYPELADTIYDRNPDDPEKPQAAADDPFGGALQKIDTANPEPELGGPVEEQVQRVGVSSIRSAIERNKNWLNTRYRPFNDTGCSIPTYYLYVLERTGTGERHHLRWTELVRRQFHGRDRQAGCEWRIRTQPVCVRSNQHQLLPAVPCPLDRQVDRPTRRSPAGRRSVDRRQRGTGRGRRGEAGADAAG
ncbi:MAG: prenyltransferase/squalene oxidase repeat-containing protein [Planctomycetaceae bacterium]